MIYVAVAIILVACGFFWWLQWRSRDRYLYFHRGDIVSIDGQERRVVRVDRRESTVTVDKPFVAESSSVVRRIK